MIDNLLSDESLNDIAGQISDVWEDFSDEKLNWEIDYFCNEDSVIEFTAKPDDPLFPGVTMIIHAAITIGNSYFDGKVTHSYDETMGFLVFDVDIIHNGEIVTIVSPMGTGTSPKFYLIDLS